ncbi:hypothetical protein BDF19DRAFT_444649 [Syncephalis fuscata]|nr:hypothetical protein BDF19DRAFT_444649 [Syncephalis fuscata]
MFLFNHAHYCALVFCLFLCKKANAAINTFKTTTAATNDGIKNHHAQRLNILFSAGFGGKSHATPQLEMADILAERGHKITFASFNSTVIPWLADHPRLHPLGIGESPNDVSEFISVVQSYMQGENDLKTVSSKEVSMILLKRFYPKHYRLFRAWILENNVDVMVCDFFVAGCYDAAYETGTSFVITTNMLSHQGLDHQPYLSGLMSYLPATHESTTFMERLKDVIVDPILDNWAQKSYRKIRHELFAELGVTPYNTRLNRWRQGFILSNNFFGFEVDTTTTIAQHIFNWPYMPRTYPSLPSDLKYFLDTRKRVVYVGFGSNMVLPQQRLLVILRSLLVAHADGLLDVPTSMVVNGVTHNIEEMRSGKHSIVRMLNRAPQRAVLNHPSIQLFITHCGIASIYETLFAGVPILGLPVFGDQPSNAVKLQQHGVGLWIRRSQVSEHTLSLALYQLLSQNPLESSPFRTNAHRLQQMIRIADRARNRGPDLIELAAIPGAILAHQSAEWRMPWWKSGNYDLYTFTAFLFIFTGYLLFKTIRYIQIFLLSKQSMHVKQNKLK